MTTPLALVSFSSLELFTDGEANADGTGVPRGESEALDALRNPTR